MRVARIALVCLLAFSGLGKVQADFYIQGIQANADDSITITWPVVPTWTYHVMFADALDGSWQDFPDGQLTAGTNDWALCYTDTNAAAVSERFYKVWRDSAQLVMTLVLDRSGSMWVPPPNGSGGGQYLPGAVSTFISLFDDNRDQVAMVSFASTATVDVPMGRPFKSAIGAAVSNLVYAGGTFAQGGLTNALVQNNSAAVPPGQNALKVAAFFTDGYANICQNTFNVPAATLLNFGGVDVTNPGTPQWFSPTTGEEVYLGGYTPTMFEASSCICSQAVTWQNVSRDAEFRTLQLADDMRAQGTYIYSIGLGAPPWLNVTFLQQVANDPNSPTFNPNQPVGQAVIANDPTALDAVFQQIASKILGF
jgi:hypothetical protein